jgi:tetratricopeptide (TPR) repeat protein
MCYIRHVEAALLAGLLLMLGAVPACAEEAVASADDFIRSAESFLGEGREFSALGEYQNAIEKDNKRAETYGYLAILLYDLGFLDDAIEEMKKAVALSPDSVYLNMELGKLYFAKNSRGDAIEQFFSVLEMNPGHSNAYYYLGELFFRMKDYDMAWLSAKMARKMGQSGRGLIGKLRELSVEPELVPWKNPGDVLYIRQILVDTRGKAEELVNRISAGELFEDLAVMEFTGSTARLGGFLGKFEHAKVHPKIAEALLEEEALSGPYIIETEKGFHVVQRIVPFDYHTWEELMAEYKGLAREPAKPEKAEVNKGEGPFIVFVGAFKKEINAVQRANDLRELGFPSSHIHRGEWFNVVAGRYHSYPEALEAGKKISSQGYEFFIPPVK